nr:MAG TPA: hypothetical protein [Caudoviricetes sp.]
MVKLLSILLIAFPPFRVCALSLSVYLPYAHIIALRFSCVNDLILLDLCFWRLQTPEEEV